MATKKDDKPDATEEELAAKEAEEKAKAEAAAKEAESNKKPAKNKQPKTYKPGDVLGELTATRAGLPNSCAASGKKIPEDGIWFARHDDEARSGVAVCQEVAEEMAGE